MKRRAKRIALAVTAGCLTASVLAAHAERFAPADDWSTYNHRSFRVIGVDAADSWRIAAGQRQERVSLLGIVAPTGPRAAAATAYAERFVGSTVRLMLQSPQTRDDQGRLLAYAFSSDCVDLGADVVRHGAAFVERRTHCLLEEPLDSAEREARKAHAGLWRDLKWQDMPRWRQWWVSTLPRRSK